MYWKMYDASGKYTGGYSASSMWTYDRNTDTNTFSKIDKYIFTNTNYGDYEEEALEFDSEGKLIHIKLNMENSDYNVEESNDETYKIGYSEGIGIHFTYDNNGLLIKESMSGRGEEDINYICFDYDEKGRIVKAYGSIESVEINDTYKYDEDNKKGY